MIKTNSKHGDITQSLLANSYLNGNIDKLVLQRFEDEYKAHPPEFGIDIKALADQAYKNKSKEEWRNRIRVIIAAIGCIIYVRYGGWILTLSVVVALSWLLEMVFDVISKSRKSGFSTSKFEEFVRSEPSNLEAATSQNVIVFGGFSPFVGSGTKIRSWSFSIDLSKPERPDQTPSEVHIEELYNEVTSELQKLNIEAMVINDQLLADGTMMRRVDGIHTSKFGKPKTVVNQNIIEQYIGKNNSNIRHYKVVRVVLWEGNLVLSVYFRFAKLSNNLYVEANFLLLPPLNSELINNIDEAILADEQPDESEMLGTFIANAIKAPFVMLSVIFTLLEWLGNILSAFSDKDPKREHVEKNDKYNYGYSMSMREYWAHKSYEKYFQVLDVDLYQKIIQQQLVDSLIDALECRGISTESIKERSTSIINEGVIMSGGSINSESIAVGNQASSAIKNIVENVRAGASRTSETNN